MWIRLCPEGRIKEGETVTRTLSHVAKVDVRPAQSLLRDWDVRRVVCDDVEIVLPYSHEMAQLYMRTTRTKPRILMSSSFLLNAGTRVDNSSA